MVTMEMGDDWPARLVDLYRDERSSLVRLATLLTGSREVGEEVVHDAFVAVRGKWDGVRDPLGYLRGAVANRSRMAVRRRGVEARHAATVVAPAGVELGATSSPSAETHRALGRLGHRQRTAVVLRYYLDLADDDIAAVLGCRPATVRSLIHRGVAALRKELEPS